MAQSSMHHVDQPSVVKATLGSIVVSGEDYGVVWQVTRDMLRVLPIRQGATCVPLSLAIEVELHLPVSPFGWCIVYDQMQTWPRALCRVVAEVEERCLLRILQARKTPSFALAPVLASKAMSGGVHQGSRFF